MKIKIKDANVHINRESGYAQISIALGSILSEHGHDVYYDFITGCDDVVLDKLAKKLFTHTPDTIYLWVRPPHYVKDPSFNPEHKNIFLTMHESNKLEGWKADWAELLNKTKAVIVPTEWNKKTFETFGVTVPMHVVPLGISLTAFSPYKEQSFNVMTCHEGLGSQSSRENWKITVDAYEKLFAERNSRLTIKTWKMKRDEWKKIYDTLKSTVVVVEGSMYPYDLAELYKRHQVFIKNSNLEGWSYPLTEAMACGLRVIAYDNPVLRENVRTYSDVRWFKRQEQLEAHLNEAFKEWREKRKMMEMFSSVQMVRKIEEVLHAYE